MSPSIDSMSIGLALSVCSPSCSGAALPCLHLVLISALRRIQHEQRARTQISRGDVRIVISTRQHRCISDAELFGMNQVRTRALRLSAPSSSAAVAFIL
eukprot:6183108-Pleurochrysis_carterae.AAC.3